MQKILIVFCLSAAAQLVTAQQQDIISDPLYFDQWHLKNSGQSGGAIDEDINVESVWNEYKGTNTYIAIVDGSLNYNHLDLIDNMSTRHNVHYNRSTEHSSHAISVAGIAAARDNSIGVRGVAPRAKIYNFNIFGNSRTTILSAKTLVDIVLHHSRITAVSNNSWGASNPFTLSGTLNTMWRSAIETGISRGFYGKGTVYVFSAGNHHCSNDSCGTGNANYEVYTNHHAIIAVCAVDDQGRHNGSSEFGASLWVCAPSRGRSRPGITTTVDGNTLDEYTSTFSGTSASAPMVSGVVALMREANPNLGWRDVKLILANSARQNDTTDSGWQKGATKYGSFSGDGDRGKYHFNHKYGFGVVNAQKAVELAKNWINLPPREVDAWGHSNNAYIDDRITATFSTPKVFHYQPDNAASIYDKTTTSNITILSDINFTEYVDVFVNFKHPVFYDLSIKLTSPSGTASELVTAPTKIVSGKYSGNWRFGSARHLGEDPNGTWKLNFINTRTTSGTLVAWSIKVRGYQVKMDTVVANDLSKSNLEHNPLILSLSGAEWRQNPPLQPSDFKLKNAPNGLSVKEVHTSRTQVRLTLASREDFSYNHQFQVEATTATVSNYAKPLLSNDIEIFANIVRNTVAASDASMNLEYNLKIDLADIFGTRENLSYTVNGLDGSGLTASITKINGRNTMQISGAPTTSGNYRVYIIATASDGEHTTYFSFRILPIEVHIKAFLEGILK